MCAHHSVRRPSRLRLGPFGAPTRQRPDSRTRTSVSLPSNRTKRNPRCRGVCGLVTATTTRGRGVSPENLSTKPGNWESSCGLSSLRTGRALARSRRSRRRSLFRSRILDRADPHVRDKGGIDRRGHALWASASKQQQRNKRKTRDTLAELKRQEPRRDVLPHVVVIYNDRREGCTKEEEQVSRTTTRAGMFVGTHEASGAQTA